MLKFANKDLPDYIKVTNIQYSILPSLESKTEKVYGRAGSYDFGVEIGERVIEVDIMLIAETQNDVMKKAREFSKFLFYKELQPLILLDEPDKQYMARVTGDTDVSELYRTGTATITFNCPNAYAESITEKVVNYTPTDYTPIAITNNGSAETFPIIDLTVKETITSIAVMNDEKFVQVGGEATVDKEIVDTEPISMTDNMSSITGWTSGIAVDGGDILGTFESTGTALKQKGDDYGEGTKWHGGAMVKSLPAPIQNFRVTSLVELRASNINQVGRVELYLFDENNEVLGKLSLADTSTTSNHTIAEARAGTRYTGEYFVQSYGDYKGVFASYFGIMQITRQGDLWSAYFAKVDMDTGTHHTRLYETWYDTNQVVSKGKLAKIQIHVGTQGTHSPINMANFTNLEVYEKTGDVDYNTQVPVMFNAGDLVTIDSQRAVVLKNGEPIFTELDPSSDFFPLEVGTNGLIVSPPLASVSVKYKERWL
jgi:predicted phage tail component-like protein